jgi:predicted ester cyclase
MTKIGCVVLASLLAVGAGCKKDEKKDEAETSGKMASKETKDTAKPDEAKPTRPARKAPTTGEEVAALYQECWSYYNDKKWDDFKSCFADNVVVEQVDSGMEPRKGPDGAIADAKVFADAFPDSKGEQQLVLVNGNNIWSITHFTGTHTGPLKSPMGEIPPTQKTLSIPIAHGIEFDAEGRSIHEWVVMDGTSMMGQLGLLPPGVPFRASVDSWPEKQIVVAKNDDTEKRNVDAYNKGVEMFNKHDVKAMDASAADGLVWNEMAMPKAMDKKEMSKGAKDMFAGFPDMKLTPTTVWGAGDYVVAVGTMSGTNTGKMTMMPLDKTGKKMDMHFVEIDHFAADGKLDKAWLFYNGAAMAQQLGMMPPADEKKPAPPK